MKTDPPSTPIRSRPPGARGRLLEAAGRVFARDGMEAATTRAIAREARVNEVTLFRHFGTKERLISEVVRRSFPLGPPGEAPPAQTANLRADLEALGLRYQTRMRENMPLIRTLIGEVHRRRKCTHVAVKGIFAPLRAALVERLRRALCEGEIRRESDPEMSADLFYGALFTGVLRRSIGSKPVPYSPDAYRQECVELFLRGLAPARRP